MCINYCIQQNKLPENIFKTPAIRLNILPNNEITRKIMFYSILTQSEARGNYREKLCISLLRKLYVQETLLQPEYVIISKSPAGLQLNFPCEYFIVSKNRGRFAGWLTRAQSSRLAANPTREVRSVDPVIAGARGSCEISRPKLNHCQLVAWAREELFAVL